MPSLLTSFMQDVGSCYAPISLILAGFTIASYPLGQMFTQWKSYLVAFLRLLLIPALVLLGAYFLRVSKETATLLALVFSGPCGMNVVVFPASYNQDCRAGSSIVLLSSLCSVTTIPLIYALVQLLF